MDIGYSTGKETFERRDSQKIKEEFLITGIFKPSDVNAVYSNADRIEIVRIVIMGVMPLDECVDIEKSIDTGKDFGVSYMFERREFETLNIEGPNKVYANGSEYDMAHFDGLYLPMDTFKWSDQ